MAGGAGGIALVVAPVDPLALDPGLPPGNDDGDHHGNHEQSARGEGDYLGGAELGGEEGSYLVHSRLQTGARRRIWRAFSK